MLTQTLGIIDRAAVAGRDSGLQVGMQRARGARQIVARLQRRVVDRSCADDQPLLVNAELHHDQQRDEIAGGGYRRQRR